MVQIICKPDSVPPLFTAKWIAIYLALPLPVGSCGFKRRPGEHQPFRVADSLQQVGFTAPCRHRQGLKSSYLLSFHPYLRKRRRYCFCGTFPRLLPGTVFSRETTRDLLPVAVSNHHALSCPDFPLAPFDTSSYPIIWTDCNSNACALLLQSESAINRNIHLLVCQLVFSPRNMLISYIQGRGHHLNFLKDRQ